MKEAFDLIKERLEELFCGEYDTEYIKKDSVLSIVSEVEAEFGKDINVRGNGWIDVKDRLPEKAGYYLTCDHKGNIHVFYHHQELKENAPFGICENHPQFYKPIAWRELPEPYKPGEKEKE